MPKEIRRDEVRRLVERGATLIEVLSSQAYDQEHLPGAINLPLEELTAATAARLERDLPAIVYCYDTQ
jgi:rhodanese-related sulfurtransferase